MALAAHTQPSITAPSHHAAAAAAAYDEMPPGASQPAALYRPPGGSTTRLTPAQLGRRPPPPPARAATPVPSDLSRLRSPAEWGLAAAAAPPPPPPAVNRRRAPLPTAVLLAAERTTPLLGTSAPTKYETAHAAFFGAAPRLEPAVTRRTRMEMGLLPPPPATSALGPPVGGSRRASHQGPGSGFRARTPAVDGTAVLPSVLGSQRTSTSAQDVRSLNTGGSNANNNNDNSNNNSGIITITNNSGNNNRNGDGNDMNNGAPAAAPAAAVASAAPRPRRTRGDFSVHPLRDMEDFQMDKTAVERKAFTDFAKLMQAGGAAGNTIQVWPYRVKGVAMGRVVL